MSTFLLIKVLTSGRPGEEEGQASSMLQHKGVESVLNMPPYRIKIMVFMKMTVCQIASYATHNLNKENDARHSTGDDWENKCNYHFFNSFL